MLLQPIRPLRCIHDDECGAQREGLTDCTEQKLHQLLISLCIKRFVLLFSLSFPLDSERVVMGYNEFYTNVDDISSSGMEVLRSRRYEFKSNFV